MRAVLVGYSFETTPIHSIHANFPIAYVDNKVEYEFQFPNGGSLTLIDDKRELNFNRNSDFNIEIKITETPKPVIPTAREHLIK